MTRPRLQLHLSTLLIVLLLAAVLLWLNLGERGAQSRQWMTADDWQVLPAQQWGWPFIFQWRNEGQPWNGKDVWIRNALLQDIGIGLALLATAAAVIEWARGA